MSLTTLALLVVGLGVLTAGAELLVRGASRLAAAVGVSPLIVGLTVVAYGTSAPELAVSVRAALVGQADVAIGNVVGSNNFNILLILGLSAAITPLLVASQLLRFDLWFMLAASAAVLVASLDGRIDRLAGLLLLAGGIAYTAWLIRQSRRESQAIREEFARQFGGAPQRATRAAMLNIGLVVVGLALLVLGARWLVDASVAIARALGASELLIGLTIVAAGTSLPEAATSVVAALRGQRDIAVGNVIGSNIFNILTVLALTAIVSPSGVPVAPAALRFDIPFMIGVAVLCFPIFYTGRQIARWEGLLLLGLYAAYLVFRIFTAAPSSGH